jgi:predicted acetyltransferase
MARLEREWIRYGAYSADGRLLGTVSDLKQHHWLGGRRVSAADVGWVAVLPEARGGGVARALLAALLEGARDRGAAVSALFPTVASVYRDAGWAAVGTRRRVEIPTAHLGVRRPRTGLSVRAGDDADRVAAGALYTAVARTRNGLQCREAPPWGPVGFLDEEVDGITVVEDDEGMVGFATWDRGQGHDEDAAITVVDMVATTTAATRELIGVLGGWHMVAPTTRFRALLPGVVEYELPLERASRNEIDLFMYRPVEIARAVGERGWPGRMRASATFQLIDDLAPWNAGAWVIEIAGGEGRIEPASGRPPLRLDVKGFTLLTTGVMTPTMLIEAGLLEMDPGTDPTPLERLMVGPPVVSLDYF